MIKLDIIKRTFRKLKLVGASSDPQIPQYDDALLDLEYMMAEWDKMPSVNTGYNSTGENASLDEESGLTLGDVNAVSANLALRIGADYNIEAPPTVVAEARAGLSDLMKRGATIPIVKYNNRAPVGRGNWRGGYGYGFRRSYYPTTKASSKAEQFKKDEVVNYTVSFRGWLLGNSIASVEWSETNNQVTITDVANNTTETSAKLTFSNVGVYTVKVTATDNLGQVETIDLPFAVNPK